MVMCRTLDPCCMLFVTYICDLIALSFVMFKTFKTLNLLHYKLFTQAMLRKCVHYVRTTSASVMWG